MKQSSHNVSHKNLTLSWKIPKSTADLSWLFFLATRQMVMRTISNIRTVATLFGTFTQSEHGFIHVLHGCLVGACFKLKQNEYQCTINTVRQCVPNQMGWFLNPDQLAFGINRVSWMKVPWHETFADKAHFDIYLLFSFHM